MAREARLPGAVQRTRGTPAARGRARRPPRRARRRRTRQRADAASAATPATRAAARAAWSAHHHSASSVSAPSSAVRLRQVEVVEERRVHRVPGEAELPRARLGVAAQVPLEAEAALGRPQRAELAVAGAVQRAGSSVGSPFGVGRDVRPCQKLDRRSGRGSARAARARSACRGRRSSARRSIDATSPQSSS